MLSAVDFYKEVKKYEELILKDSITDTEYKKAVIKLSILQNKLMLNIRTNIALTMVKLGVEKVKPKIKDGEIEE